KSPDDTARRCNRGAAGPVPERRLMRPRYASRVRPAPYEIAPFAAVLLSLSVIPSVWPRLWERRTFRLAWAAALVAASAAMSVARGATDEILRTGREYVDLVALLFALFVISGGIALAGRLEGTPAVNVVLIGIGAVLASLLGTPGAAALTVRPYLHANRRRRR